MNWRKVLATVITLIVAAFSIFLYVTNRAGPNALNHPVAPFTPIPFTAIPPIPTPLPLWTPAPGPTLPNTSWWARPTPAPDPNRPAWSFSSIKVNGLNSADISGFGGAMAQGSWTPAITCVGDHCVVGSLAHLHTPATIVMVSGHGYVGDKGYYMYSNLDEALHPLVDREGDRAEAFTYQGASVWDESEYFDELTAWHQQNATDWLVIAACNQLRSDTRGDIAAAMGRPAQRPLKGVLSYGDYSGTARDDLIMEAFARMCLRGAGQGKVATAWLAANDLYEPFMGTRARALVRDGFQTASLTSPFATAGDAGRALHMWRMGGVERVSTPLSTMPNRVAVTLTIQSPKNRGEVVQVPTASPADTAACRAAASSGAAADMYIPRDFILHKTNTIYQGNADGQNEHAVALLATFSRSIDGIRVSTDPEYGEVINLIMDGTGAAEMDALLRNGSAISTQGAIMANAADLLSREAAILRGLTLSRQVQEAKRGSPLGTALTLKAIEPVYVVSPQNPTQLVLAWDVMDDGYFSVVIDAQSGELLYHTK